MRDRSNEQPWPSPADRPDGLAPLHDEDVVTAASSMAGTLEAACQGRVAHLTGSNTVSEGLRRTFDENVALMGQQGGHRGAGRSPRAACFGPGRNLPRDGGSGRPDGVPDPSLPCYAGATSGRPTPESLMPDHPALSPWYALGLFLES